MNSEMEQYLQATPTINFRDETVEAFVGKFAGNIDNQTQQAVNLYYAVRDGIRYNPYKFDLSVKGLRASTTLNDGEGWCVPKAILLAACCRAIGIPARLGFADVKNHLSTARMREQMKTDVFLWHGYTSIYLEGAWVKSTPAFNIELCEKFRLKPLEFDGRDDSIYHPFDLEGNKHMEYIRSRGEFADIPIELMMETFIEEYGGAFSMGDSDVDFEADILQETTTIGK
ncbi:MAG: transglutaminase family protein [Proteobacteria bacterium]|nr:transglutaminase family protein [Pseudomonadota bacterium]